MIPSTHKKVLILLQLGSPDAPTPEAVKKYLAEFLSDPRVMDISPIARTMILNLFILPKRPKAVAPKYQGIWMEEGSPLTVESKRLTAKMQALLPDTRVELAMRYGNPSLKGLLDQLKSEGIEEITFLPLFPQYASATSGSAIELFLDKVKNWQVIPSIKIINQFFDHPAFIKTWVEQGKPYLKEDNQHILFSFHGLPESQIKKADCSGACLQTDDCCDKMSEKNHLCYRAQSFQTARLIAEGLGISEEQYSICFQSRLGKAKWIEPYTTDVIGNLAKEGKENLLVFSPAFVADCLETLEELEIEEKENFLEHGGKSFTVVPSLNSQDSFASALLEILKDLG